MRIPRDINGEQFAKALRLLGYGITRQTGSHIRLTTLQNGQHHVTVPNHNPISIGTLSSILSDVADHFKKSKEEIIKILF